MSKYARYAAQAVFYGVFMVVVGYFATSPAYTHLAPDQAMIKLSFAHSGKIAGECRERTPEELAKLPPNMRVPMECPRERSPIIVEFELNDDLVYSAVLRPTGLSRDGAAYVYEAFQVPSGEHRISVRMRDDVRTEGFDHEFAQSVTLAPRKLLVIDFIAERGGFMLANI
jgi:hypothetical protein